METLLLFQDKIRRNVELFSLKHLFFFISKQRYVTLGYGHMLSSWFIDLGTFCDMNIRISDLNALRRYIINSVC